jgi:hypothetical protein
MRLMATPVLVVRAAIEESVMDEFLKWYVRDHLPHVMAIPGVVRAFRSTCNRRGINWTTLYELKDDASVQLAITSPEADQARRDWERWLPHISELSVEVYASLTPAATFRREN